MNRIDVDLAVAALSSTQHGVWNRRQALAAGMSGSAIDRRVRSGRWLRLDTAVYADAAVPATWQRSVMAAVLAEREAVASHRAAGVLHRLEGIRCGRPEITVPAGAHARGRTARVHRGVDVARTKVDGIPCVTIGQVFVDLAQVVTEDRLRTALVRRTSEDRWVLDAVRDRYCKLAPRGGRNLRPLRAVLDCFGAGELPTETELERKLRHLVDEPGVPPVRWQAPFPGRAAGSQRVDGLIDEWRLVLEADGRAWHTRVDDFERDKRRDAEAAAAGYQTLRYTWRQLTAEPDWCLATLLATGAARSSVAA
jgi:very-short-patch-repair endonuclease